MEKFGQQNNISERTKVSKLCHFCFLYNTHIVGSKPHWKSSFFIVFIRNLLLFFYIYKGQHNNYINKRKKPLSLPFDTKKKIPNETKTHNLVNLISLFARYMRYIEKYNGHWHIDFISKIEILIYD